MPEEDAERTIEVQGQKFIAGWGWLRLGGAQWVTYLDGIPVGNKTLKGLKKALEDKLRQREKKLKEQTMTEQEVLKRIAAYKSSLDVQKDDPVDNTEGVLGESTSDKPMPGDIVLANSDTCSVPKGRHGIIAGEVGKHRPEAVVCFNFSAFRGPSHGDAGPEVVSPSGGPAPILTLAELKPSGRTKKVTFWKWKDGRMPAAGQGVYYDLTVPVWLWNGDDAFTEAERMENGYSAEDKEKFVAQFEKNCGKMTLFGKEYEVYYDSKKDKTSGHPYWLIGPKNAVISLCRFKNKPEMLFPVSWGSAAKFPKSWKVLEISVGKLEEV